jgi:imidazolonepropionase-like amidohydrolase
MKTTIKDARIIDCNGSVLEDGFIQFDETGILAISDKPLTGGTEIDGTGKTVMPGLFDCHVHIGGLYEMLLQGRLYEVETMTAIKTFVQCQELLSFGITTFRNMGTLHDCDIWVRDMINSGYIKGPRILASGTVVTITGGHCHFMGTECDTVGEALKAARAQMKKGADVIKMFGTGGVATPKSNPEATQMSEDQMRAVAEAAAEAGVITGAHCLALAGTKNAIRAGVRSIEHAYMLDQEAVELMVEKKLFYCPTLVAPIVICESTDPRGQWMKKKMIPFMQNHEKAFKLSIAAGVKIAAGTDANCPFNPISTLAKELGLYVEYGMTNMEALISATKTAAELCMVDNVVGTLEVGKLADLIILDGNPLTDIQAISRVNKTFRSGDLLYQKG